MAVFTLLVMGVEALFSVLAFRGLLYRQQARQLAFYLREVRSAVVVENGRVSIDPELLPVQELSGRFSVERAGRVVLEGGGPFPASGTGWVTAASRLGGNLVLKVALNMRDQQGLMSEYQHSLLTTIALAVLIALLLGYALLRVLMGPLRRLEAASRAVAVERLPRPLPVVGKDELARLMQSFNEMVQRVHAALERERSFTRYASHELRTPLAGLRANVEGLQAKVISLEEALPALSRGTMRMQRTLEALLALARAPEEVAEVSLDQLVAEILDGLDQPARTRICMELTPGRTNAPLHSLAGAVRNLVENALKYSSGPVWLRLEAEPCLRIEVRDEGPGVPAQLRKRLGEPFFRLQQGPGGLGLGLAYVRQVAELTGGGLEFSQAREGGLAAILRIGGRAVDEIV